MAKKAQKIIPKAGWAIYLRTSSDENQKPELSRARQRQAIEEYVLKRSDMPIYKEYVDVLTGKTADRRGYQEMLNDARSGKFSHVVVERADRFGRNDTEALRAVDELHEYGVAVRFANQPGLDPMDVDQRVFATMAFSLARRESELLGIRVRGGLRAKREMGGHIGKAPDGYVNVQGTMQGHEKALMGRVQHWIEPDPIQWQVWREAWDLLLEDRYTLKQICEILHQRGHKLKSGRPFAGVTADDKRANAVNTLSAIFKNWFYAGWIVSETQNIAPKTLRGDWKPVVSTEEFERGLAIMEKRYRKRAPKFKHFYLLQGLIYLKLDKRLKRLNGSTPNVSRTTGGTSYYCLDGKGFNLPCELVDGQVATHLCNIGIAPEYLPLIHELYRSEVEALYINPDDEIQRLNAILDDIKHEQDRVMRLYIKKEVTEEQWGGLWRDWQDRQNAVQRELALVSQTPASLVQTLDESLELLNQLSQLYGTLTREDQREILRCVVEKVVVDAKGIVLALELHPPFAYLAWLIDEAKKILARRDRMKNATHFVGGVTQVDEQLCSRYFLESWETRTRT